MMSMVEYKPGVVSDPRKTPAVAIAAMSIFWPSFLSAAAMTGLFFSALDPTELLVFGKPIEVSRHEAYGMGFMIFWAFSAISSAMTYVLTRPPVSSPDELDSRESS